MHEKVDGWVLDKFVAPGASLTQGDLIKFKNDDENPTKNAGIVVTADCDLERKKHAKLITLIPLVSVTVILENYLLLEECEKKKDLIQDFFLRSIGMKRDKNIDIAKEVIRSEFKAENYNKFDPIVVAAKVFTDELEYISISSYKKLMTEIGVSPKKSIDLKQQISTRGDLLVLPSTKDFDIEGNVAWIRHIWQVPLNSIAIRTSEVASKIGEKVARLDSPYRYRLTQLLSQVFSDIGLPDTPNSLDESMRSAYE